MKNSNYNYIIYNYIYNIIYNYIVSHYIQSNFNITLAEAKIETKYLSTLFYFFYTILTYRFYLNQWIDNLFIPYYNFASSKLRFIPDNLGFNN